MDFIGNVGKNTSLILNSIENPYISYFDVTNQTLKFAYRAPQNRNVDHLQINTQPASTLSVDSPFNTAAMVTAYDASNNPVSSASIVADRDPATGSGTLRGTLSVNTNASGQATFSNLAYDKTDAFKVRFTSNAKTVISSQVGPLAAGAPVALTVSTAPVVGASVDADFATQPVILVKDQFNNPVSGVTVTASRGTGTGALRGTLTAVSNASGLATFTNLGYNKSGEAFTIHFAAGSLTVDSASLGPLAAGAATQVKVETVADGSGTVVPAQSVTASNTLTVYGVTRDQFGNYVANPSGTAWSLTNKTGGVGDSEYQCYLWRQCRLHRPPGGNGCDSRHQRLADRRRLRDNHCGCKHWQRRRWGRRWRRGWRHWRRIRHSGVNKPGGNGRRKREVHPGCHCPVR